MNDYAVRVGLRVNSPPCDRNDPTLESTHREYNLILNLHCEHDSHSLYANS